MRYFSLYQICFPIDRSGQVGLTAGEWDVQMRLSTSINNRKSYCHAKSELLIFHKIYDWFFYNTSLTPLLSVQSNIGQARVRWEPNWTCFRQKTYSQTSSKVFIHFWCRGFVASLIGCLNEIGKLLLRIFKYIKIPSD